MQIPERLANALTNTLLRQTWKQTLATLHIIQHVSAHDMLEHKRRLHTRIVYASSKKQDHVRVPILGQTEELD